MNATLFAQSRRLLASFPLLHRLAYKIIYRLFDKQLTWGNRQISSIEVFDKIFETNEWGSDESLSGRGSTLAATEMIRRSLPKLMRDYDIRTMLDAPCGDFHWMAHTSLPEGSQYIGGDIVERLVADVSKAYASPSRRFMHFDILSSPIPDVDLWLCRETLFHFPNEYIWRVLTRFRDSNLKYLLTTTFDFPSRNENIHMGDFRMLNLRISPFSLPKPLAYLDDFTFPEAPRRLGLWSREQLTNWRAPLLYP